MTPEIVPFAEAEKLLSWHDLMQAIEDAHAMPRAEIGDTFLQRDPDTVLSRAAWIDGLGVAIKTATVFPGNPAHDKPVINGALSLYSDADGTLDALVDFHLVTKWKTAADSLLAARELARPDSKTILIVGAGTVGHSLYEAYSALFPDAEFLIWNRSAGGATRMAQQYENLRIVADLETGVRAADIITSATMSLTPLIKGAWLQRGQHIDLIGAYRSDMRETDDLAMQRARIFVDSRETTLTHIGELRIPIANGAITDWDVQADFYDMHSGVFSRQSDDDITLFKNGGGAHLDLITGRYILNAWRAR